MRIRVAQLRLVVVLLLMGLGVSVVVAEWCAVRGTFGDPSVASRIRDAPGTSWNDGDGPFKPLRMPSEPDPEPKLMRLGAIIPPEWASAYTRASQTCPAMLLLVRRRTGVDEEVLAYMNMVLDDPIVVESMIRRRAGWPLRCLAGTGWNSHGRSNSERWIDAIDAPGWLVGSSQARWRLGSTLPQQVLLEPIPIGLAVNSAVYALVLFFLWTGWRRVVGARRRRRNRCVGCNYSREGLGVDAPCPECGLSTSATVRV